MTRASLAALILVVLCAAACTDTATTPSQSPAFQKIDLALGSGAVAASGNTLTVNYSGWLYDPTKSDFKGLPFDSANAFSFTLGTGAVIGGWDQGLVGMNVGGVRRLVIPPSLAYGNSRSGKIPPDATLVFDVTLTAVQ
ncbi:MAG TPA: FKBP-type peptidyl-prolyl cis-trans isomerase [Vicinamibacterales bacterium]|nr:FKBP-type peptidyl-prolyl cis-trans isomerase [Vicinamibacterales bacterium]